MCQDLPLYIHYFVHYQFQISYRNVYKLLAYILANLEYH